MTVNAQRTGFAIRKGLAFERQPDFTEIQVGNPDLRSGVDLLVRPARGAPVPVLSVHLKAGCTSGDRNEACPVLFQQVPALERWIDSRAAEGVRFAVLGDFNRRLVMPGDAVWADWDDAAPANADDAAAQRFARRVDAGLRDLRFDAGQWVARQPGATPSAKMRSAQALLLPLPPVTAVPPATDPDAGAFVRAALLDPAYQLK